jgi:adenosylmethionine-8-amino-7-oxononanoate aminotransferase
MSHEHLLFPTTNLQTVREQGEFMLARGKGVYVYDDDGKEYLEGLSGLWCTALGYGNEELVETAAEQMRTFSYGHMFGGKCHHPGMDLADRLAGMVPVPDAVCFFGNSGSDANDTQVKLLRYYFNAIGKPEKCKIIARDRGYHGVTVASAALTGLPPMHAHFDLPLDALHVLRTDCPHFYREGRPGETEDEFAARLADKLEQLILREGPDTVAAFIAEPVNGAGGVVVPPAGYFPRVQEILRRYDILFLADEVITGFGRTGARFGSDTFDLQPQMMTLAKALSSAYMPISAAVIPGFMHEAIREQSGKVGVFGHGYTYSGHPVAAAVALKALEIYERERIYERAATLGDYLQRRLQAFSDHPLVGEVRGIGMIGAVELVADKPSRRPFEGGAVGQYCVRRAQEHGLICRPLGNSVAFCPPLIITEQQIDQLAERFAKALDDTLDHVSREGLIAA